MQEACQEMLIEHLPEAKAMSHAANEIERGPQRLKGTFVQEQGVVRAVFQLQSFRLEHRNTI
jgi:hypothetical protein